MLKLALVIVGGAAGSLLRYLLQGWVQQTSQSAFPLGTLVVNVVGCFFIGVILGSPVPMRVEYRVGLTVGVLGGFTTFSTFGWETFSLLKDGDLLRAALNVSLSVGLGLAAVWLGYRLVQRWQGV